MSETSIPLVEFKRRARRGFLVFLLGGLALVPIAIVLRAYSIPGGVKLALSTAPILFGAIPYWIYTIVTWDCPRCRRNVFDHVKPYPANCPACGLDFTAAYQAETKAQ
jgi:hypothetical protein